MNCWICGAPGDSREHKTKKSDLKAVFGHPSQKTPLYYNDASSKNRIIGGLNANLLKSSARMCSVCNSTRTQPYDRAWEKLSHVLRQQHGLRPGFRIRGDHIFRSDTRRGMLAIHLYFVKLFGCHIVSTAAKIDLIPFQNAILSNVAHRNVHLKFGCTQKGLVGTTDLELAIDADTGDCAFCVWSYVIEGIAVLVMYARPGEKRDGLLGSWHPNSGKNSLLMADFVH
jgi:hypothetical protein